jgi:hypothetical protein
VNYLLYRVEQLGSPPAGMPLGDYPSFDTALAARDEDVIAQLAERPTPPREISHLIVGPGLRGPRTEHPIVTFAGADVDDPDPSAEASATEAWLESIRGR